MALLPPSSLTRPQPAPISFETIKQAACPVLSAILRRLLPGGRIQSGEYFALNPRRQDRTPGSFKVRVHGKRAGAWADFATGDSGGDVISLVAYVDGVSQREAAARLGRLLNIHEGF